MTNTQNLRLKQLQFILEGQGKIPRGGNTKMKCKIQRESGGFPPYYELNVYIPTKFICGSANP